MTTDVKRKKYHITDLFDIRNTKSILKEQIRENSGNVPYVTAGESNNAVMTYIDCPEEWVEEGNCILIGGKTMIVTYQEYNFCSNDSHNLALYLRDKHLNRFVGLYLVASIKKSLSHKYQWGDSISYKKIQKDTVNLPSTITKKPDWKLISEIGQTVRKPALTRNRLHG